jgi:hypothetical protein
MSLINLTIITAAALTRWQDRESEGSNPALGKAFGGRKTSGSGNRNHVRHGESAAKAAYGESHDGMTRKRRLGGHTHRFVGLVNELFRIFRQVRSIAHGQVSWAVPRTESHGSNLIGA